MSVKSVLGTVVGFLTHHVDDLNAVTGTLSALLDALPVNAETRQHIADMISQVQTSADNIVAALPNLADLAAAPPVTIRESDIETAVRGVFASGALDTTLSGAIAAYIAAHPVTATATAPAPDPAQQPLTNDLGQVLDPATGLPVFTGTAGAGS